MHEGSRKAVLAACVANAGIGVAKLVGFLLTGATSMLAEAVHSVADTGNQALLLLGSARAKRQPTAEHPFGYGRERYFWSFIVALVIFLLGAVFAIYEGVHKWLHPEPLDRPGVALSILAACALLEGFSFVTAVKAARALRGDASWWAFIRRSKHAELPVVLLEDLGALLGLVFAMIAIGIALATGDTRYDGLGSIGIGVLLGAIAIVLATEMQSLLIGESASPEQVAMIESAIAGAPEVEHVVHLRTTHLGPDQLLIGVKVVLSRRLDAPAIAHAIDEIERRVRDSIPERAVIYVEPDLLHPAPREGEEPDSH